MHDVSNILVDRAPSSDLLTYAGAPVFPARTEQEAKALQTLCELFAVNVREVRGDVASCASEVGEKAVVSLGEIAHEPARLYAHLTGRRWMPVASVEELPRVDGLEVLLTDERHVQHTLLECLFEIGLEQGNLPGLIYARTQAALRRQALTKAAACGRSGPLERRWIDVQPTFNVGAMTAPGRDLYGRAAAGEEILCAVGDGSGLVSFITHSDGLDASLGGNLIACALDRQDEEADPHRSPHCLLTKTCFRLNASLDEAWRSGRLVAPEAIRARVLLWVACWGLLPGNGQLFRALDPGWGLMPRMANHPAIGAILTTWHLSVTGPADFEDLSAEIASGMPVGEAAARHLRSARARARGLQLCLLGDPKTVLPPPTPRQGSSLQKTRLFQVPDISAPNGDDRGAPSFLRLWLEGCVRERAATTDVKSLRTARAALNNVRRYEEAVRRGEDPECGTHPLGASLRRRVLRYLCRVNPLVFGYWMPLFEDSCMTLPRPSCVCGAPVNEYVFPPHAKGATPRRMALCVECGLIADAPVSCQLALVVEREGVVRLTGEFPADKCEAALLVGYGAMSDHRSWAWPLEDGKPVRRFETERWPQGPLRVMALLMWGTELAIMQQPARGSSPYVCERS